MNIVILAGGVGTRLWPLGRKHNPKQFFPMISQKPLVKETYDRFVKKYGAGKIYFSVTPDLVKPLKKIFPNIPLKQFIVEPSRRDTAPAMGYAAVVLSLTAPDEPMVFVPADHFIADSAQYLQCFKVGEALVKETGKLLDIGITATFPSTVLGYTKIASRWRLVDGVEVFNFAGHTEKPDYAVATKYLTSGNYLWHGNYYMWTPRKFLEAFAKHQPSMHRALEKIRAWLEQNKTDKIRSIYDQLEKISFDYAITEKIKKNEVLIIKGTFGWSDIGAWDMLHTQLQSEADGGGNVIKGKVVHFDTSNCLLYAHPKRILATVGLDNLVVVDTADAILVCPKNRAQDVKKLFPELEKRGLKKYL